MTRLHYPPGYGLAIGYLFLNGLLKVTVVIGQRLGDRVLLLSDTAVTFAPDEVARPFPGQLKSVVLSGRVSVAYAGSVGRALSAVRQARQVLLHHGFGAMLQVLEAASSPLADVGVGSEADFLVASHLPKAELRIVTGGSASVPGDLFRLGNKTLADDIRKVAKPFVDRGLPEEAALLCAFTIAFSQHGPFVGEGVGGFPVSLLASPYGHTYQHTGGVITLADIALGEEPTAQSLADRQSGMSEYRLGTVSSTYRGVGILAAHLPSGSLGFIYDPLNDDHPRKLYPLTPEFDEGGGQVTLRDELDTIARESETSFLEPEEPLPWPDPSAKL